ncbi:MAG: transposase [candidate division WOR-3 bacterium]
MTTEPVDVNQVGPALAGIEEATGQKPERFLADAGYRSGPNLKLLEDEWVDGYIPETGEKHIGRTTRRNSAQYGREEFRYDREHDCYRCPAGRTMTRTSERRSKTKYSEQTKRIYRPPSGVCLACPRKAQCTVSNNLLGRSISRDDYEEERARMRQKLGTEEGKAVYGRRKCLVEPAIGQLKVIGGFRQFLLRGKQGAGIEWKWMTTALNLLKMRWKVLRGEAKLAWAT